MKISTFFAIVIFETIIALLLIWIFPIRYMSAITLGHFIFLLIVLYISLKINCK